MHLRPTVLLLVLMAAVTAALSACISDREAEQIAEAIGDKTPMALVDPLATFHAQYHRWPKDFPEFCQSTGRSDWKSTIGQYDRVDFAELPGGNLEVYVVSGGNTNEMIVMADKSAPSK